MQSVLPGVIRPLRVLWNEIIGFIFVVLALGFASPAIKALWKPDQDAGSVLRIVASTAFSLLMASFGVYSFVKARKISRS